MEAAALKAVRGTQPRTPWRVVSAITRTRTLEAVRSELVRRGLLHEPADVERLQHRWRWLVPLLIVGGLRVLADLGARQSIGLLLLAMLATVGVMIALARRRPGRTRRGDRLVAALRRRRPDLVGPPSTGMALAMGGTAGLWASDPALALAVAAPAAVTQRPLRDRLSQPGRSWWPVGGWSGGAGCSGGWDGGGGGHGCGGGGGGCGRGGGGCGGGGGGCGGGG